MKRLLARPRLLAVARGSAASARRRVARRSSPSTPRRRSPTSSRRSTPHERYSFGGSNALAAQITARRAGRRLRLGEHDAADAAPRRRASARSRSCSRATRSSSSSRRRTPAEIHSVYDLTKPGVKLVVAGTGRAGRQLHAADPQEHEPRRGGAQERRQPGDGRARGARARSRSARPTRDSSTRPTRRPCPAR